MTEDPYSYIKVLHADHWRLSGYDVEILEELRQVIRFWLPAFLTAEDVSKAAVALSDLERLSEDGTPPDYCEISIVRMRDEMNGLAADIGITNTQISLSILEFVPGPNGFPDHGAVLDEEGRPISMALTPMGSFDRKTFDAWWHLAMSCAPQDPGDPESKAKITREDI